MEMRGVWRVKVWRRVTGLREGRSGLGGSDCFKRGGVRTVLRAEEFRKGAFGCVCSIAFAPYAILSDWLDVSSSLYRYRFITVLHLLHTPPPPPPPHPTRSSLPYPHSLLLLVDASDSVASDAVQELADAAARAPDSDAALLVSRVVELASLPAVSAPLQRQAALLVAAFVRWRATRPLAVASGVTRPLTLLALDSDVELQLCAVRSLAQLAEHDNVRALVDGGVLLPLIELCRADNERVRELAVHIVTIFVHERDVRRLLAQHCALDALVPLLSVDALPPSAPSRRSTRSPPPGSAPVPAAARSASTSDAARRRRNVAATERDGQTALCHDALAIVHALVCDAECVDASRLGATDDGGITVRLTRAVTRLVPADAHAELATATLHTMLLANARELAQHEEAGTDDRAADACVLPRPSSVWLALRDADRRFVVDALRAQLLNVVSENIVDKAAEARLQRLIVALEAIGRGRRRD